MKKNDQNPKKVKKEEAKKEGIKKEKHVVTLKGLKETGKVPVERQKPVTAPKKVIPKSPEPKAPESNFYKWKIPQNIESYIKEETGKGKKPKEVIPAVMKMFDGIKRLEEKAAEKRAERAVWQVRHIMGVTRKPK